MSKAVKEPDSLIAWGDKAIREAVGRVLGYTPSMSWIRKWSRAEHPNRLPIKSLENSKLRCVEVTDLEEWKHKNVK